MTRGELIHTPLHRLGAPGKVRTAGRLERAKGGDLWRLTNAEARVALVFKGRIRPEALRERDLARVEARWDGHKLEVSAIEVIEVARQERPTERERVSASLMKQRAAACARTRRFFERRDFLEVRTPGLVAEPGTDVYIEPFKASFLPEEALALPASRRAAQRLPAYLHTSPELSMKRLLSQGFERIWQLTPVWRNGEVSALHAPEFSCLEWYRAWEPLEPVIEDCERLITRLTDGVARRYDRERGEMRLTRLKPPFERLTMRELVEQACGFELNEALQAEALKQEVLSRGLLAPRRRGASTAPMFGAAASAPRDDAEQAEQAEQEHWMELFFELQVTLLDPWLERLGAVTLTEWPAQLAVLAKRCPHDGRYAERFETYISGVECSNGFEELTDAREQRARFKEDLAQRARLDRPSYPMPERFLSALERGMPPASGVALGLDRVVMLATGARSISDVLPFSAYRHEDGRARFG